MIVDGTMEVEPFGNLAFVIYGEDADASFQDGSWSLWGAIIDAADVENWDGESERRECYCIHPGDIGLELEGLTDSFQFRIPAGGDTLHTIRERLEHIQYEGCATDGTIELDDSYEEVVEKGKYYVSVKVGGMCRVCHTHWRGVAELDRDRVLLRDLDWTEKISEGWQ